MSLENYEDAYPLSPLQEGMLFHALHTPDSGAYVTQLSCRFERLDLVAFERAWRFVVERHPILRSAFVWKGAKRPLQVVVRECRLPLVDEDWSDLAADEAAARLDAFLRRERERGFDPAKPPLLRLAVMSLADGTFYFVWSHHHLLLDGWSYALVLREVAAAYLACRRGEEPAGLPPRPYRDFIVWRERRGRAEGEQYWRRALAGFSAPTALWLDRGEGAARAGSGDHHRETFRALPQTVAVGLERLGRRRQVTASTLFHAAWALLLSHHSGEPDVVFGSVVSGRPAELEGVESMVGLFINTLPIRVVLSAREPVHSLLERLQAQRSEQLQHEQWPLVEIHRLSEVPPGTPLFTTLFTFENYPVDEAVRAHLREVGARDVTATDYSSYPLCGTAWPQGDLPAHLAYDARRYDDASAGRLLGHFVNLLAAIAAEPDAPCGDLSLLSPAERHQLLTEWNHTEAPGSPDLCIHQIFARQAERTPQAVALVSNDELLTFRSLHRRARGLAGRLVAHGVGPEETVGLLVERSAQLAVGILAILDAGGVVLPLDPELPAERLREMLEDAQPSLVLTQPHLLSRLPASTPAWSSWGAEPGEDEPVPGSWPRCRPANLAYAVFTSGSTGRPKAVMVPHAALVNFVLAARPHFALGPGDRVLQVSALGFNVVFEELFPVWASGGAVAIDRRVEHASCAELQALIVELGVTALELPAAWWGEWVRELAEAGDRPPACLRLLILGCEAPDPQRLAVWSQWSIRSIQVFGLTETTITSTLHNLRADGAAGMGELDPPIGRPIDNTTIYLLDERLDPAPLGVAGQLFIGGAGVARGYMRRPEQTAERFVPDAQSGRSGARLYRTGDLARYRADGDLELLGRADRQLKIRGFRVEPAEIEAALRRHPRVAEAVVIADRRGGGARRLAAYLVPAPGGEASRDELAPAALREFLRSILPEHMIPSALCRIERLPLSRSGKVDRDRLPLPASADGEEARLRRRPESPAERQLAAIWAEVLGVAEVGPDDDYFVLGGDSILSLQIVARALRQGLRLTPRDLFEHPVLADLASVAAAAEPPARAEEPVAAVARRSGDIPLTPIQRWLLDQNLAAPDHWNLAVLLSLGRPLPWPWLARGLARAAAAHSAFSLRFHRTPNGWRQSLADPAPAIPLAEIDLAGLPAERRAVALEAAADSVQGSLDLGDGPVLRAALVHLGAAGDRLLLIGHHLVIDVLSLQILVADVLAAVEAQAAGGDPAIALPATSFERWARRLEAHSASAELAGEVGYWLAQTAGDLARLPILDRALAARTIAFALDDVETGILLREVPRLYRAGLTEVLLLALGRALGPLTEGRPFLVDVERHGRDSSFAELDLSRSIGWFASLFPLRVEPAELAGAGAGLKWLKERWRSVPGDGSGYGVLRHLATGEGAEELRRRPVAEVLLNYVGQLDLALPGSPAALAEEPTGSPQHPANRRRHRLEVNAGIRRGRLEVVLTHDFAAALPAERIVDGFIAGLRAISLHCQEPGAGGYTPSDFPLAAPRQEDLDSLAGVVVEDLYPLSPMQQGMLFHSLLQPEEGIYFAQTHFELAGRVDEAAFAGAWRAVCELHPALRTSFLWDGLAQPLQLVRPHLELPVRVEDWRLSPAAAQERRLAAELSQDLARPVDLARPPLLRVALFRTADERWHFLWSYSQLLIDGWSLPILFGDLFAAYGALRRGDLPRLPRRAPYRTYIAWLRGRSRSGAERFWRETLAGFRAANRLPSSSPVSALRDAAPVGVHELPLSRPLSASLAELARRRQWTVNTLVQGAWALLLGRLCGARDVVFGATVSGRPPELDQIERMVGVFINTLPVRVGWGVHERFVDWLGRLQAQQVAAREHEDTPLVEVQAWSEVPRGELMFESLVVYENYPLDRALERADVGFHVRAVTTLERTNFPLVLTVLPGDAIRLRLEFDAGRFGAAEVARWAVLLETLLGGFVTAADDCPPDDLPYLREPEIQAFRREWNDVPGRRPPGVPIQALFEEQATRQPEALAAVDDGEELRYGELERRAGRCARALRALGVGPEVRVGISMERGVQTVVAILGVLKAGGAYVPLDPALPRERLELCLREAGASILLSARSAWPEPPSPSLRMLYVGEEAEPGAGPGPVVPCLTPDSLAYVVFTSGSTGVPKGVMVSHGSLVNAFVAWQESYALRPGERHLQMAGLSFDVFSGDWVRALCSGGTLIFCPRATLLEPARLGELIRRQRIDLGEFVPSVLRPLLASDQEGGAVGRLRLLVVGSDSWFREDSRAARRRLAPGARFVNSYGVSEATIDSTYYEDRRDLGGGDRPTPIGRPFANSRVHVVDRELREVPLGVAGELCIAGAGLARGYLARPELTAERFVADPFSEQVGGRLYRTGDLVRHLPDGSVEILGRIDQQVKIRGFRIEPGEIEAVLLQHPLVGQAAVVVHTTAAGPRLMAYLAPAEPPAALAEVQDFLRQRLPDYMVPASYAVLDSLPLNLSGKVDRRALPAVDPRRAPGQGRLLRPRTAVEESLAAIWCQVLDVAEIGVDESFFELGGHSLLATQLISRVREHFAVELPLRSLFEAPTVEGLAIRVTQLQATQIDERELAILLAELEEMSEGEAQARL